MNVTNKTEPHHEAVAIWSTEIKKGAASMAILAVLSRGSSYGYQIVRDLENMDITFLAFEQGTVYPLLRRLEKRGLLSSSWEVTDSEKPKKIYSITDQGEKALREMKRKWSELTIEMRKILEGDEE